MSLSSSGNVERVPHEKPVRNDSGSDDTAALRTQGSLPPGNQHLALILGRDISDEIEKHLPKLRGARLTGFLAFVAGTGFTLFGYDQGVLSALLTTKSVCEVPQIQY
jgi:hypothetical protein